MINSGREWGWMANMTKTKKMSKSYQDYKNVIYVHHSELSALIMKFDEIGLEHLTDRKECAVYFNEYDYKDKEMFINIIGEWEDNQDALK